MIFVYASQHCIQLLISFDITHVLTIKKFIIVCNLHSVNLPIVDTSEVARYVSSHDLVNLPILCYDYKLCLSTIITFEN